MSESVLSIVVSGPGTETGHRSHWALAIHQAGEETGLLLQVNVIELSRLIYQSDIRRDVPVRGRGSEGSFVVASLAQSEVKRAAELIGQEPAPRDGVERCQDWVLRAVISLEAEEIVPPGTSDWVSGLIDRPAADVAQAVSSRWTATEFST